MVFHSIATLCTAVVDILSLLDLKATVGNLEMEIDFICIMDTFDLLFCLFSIVDNLS